eukprot:gene4592-8582_t
MTSPKGGVSEVDLQDCVPIDDCNDLVQGAIGCLNEAVDDTHPKIERTNDSVHIEYETTAKVELKENDANRVELRDGTVIEKYSNGTRVITLPNGVIVESRPDGTKIIRSTSTSKVVKEYPDGRKAVLDATDVDNDQNATLISTTTPANEIDDTSSGEEEEEALAETLQTLADLEIEADEEEEEDEDYHQIPRAFRDRSSITQTDVDVPIHNSIVMCGWLWKEGGQIKSWKKRFFQLTDYSMLEYYDREPHRGGRFINVVDVFGAQVVPTEDARRPHSFYLYVSCEEGNVNNKRSKYKFAALTGTERESWMEKLRESAASKERRLSQVEQRPVVTRKFASRVMSFAKGPSLSNTVRKLVSKKKIRYQRDGFDLDLTYITPKIIAMGYPAEGTEAMYRNSYEDVYRLLEEKHATHYKLYNLCSERAYPASRFHNRVAVFPFDDHNPPPLDLMMDFCRDLDSYLKKHPLNTAVIHCKAGKGRTGVMISAYFMYSKEFSNPDDALHHFGMKRTANGMGVTIPSQRRYIRYFYRVLQLGEVPQPVTKTLNLISINDVPNFDLAGGCQPYFNVFQNGIFRYTSKPAEGGPPSFRCPPSSGMDFELSLQLSGDVKIEFVNFDRVFHQDERMFAFTFYTGFLEENKLRVCRQEVDGAHKKKHLKIYQPNFAVTLYFDNAKPEILGAIGSK